MEIADLSSNSGSKKVRSKVEEGEAVCVQFVYLTEIKVCFFVW